jgi:hypothetical protein
MEQVLARIARWLARQPWNRPGSDKTWVLMSAEDHWHWVEAVRHARRVRRT